MDPHPGVRHDSVPVRGHFHRGTAAIQLNISVLSDGATVDDPHEVTEAMLADFVEIRPAAGLSEKLTVVESAMA